MRILFVEDDADLRKALTFHLEHEGHAVDGCGDGEEALLYLRQGGYDLVLLDRMLPGLSGTEVLAQARKEGIPTPVLMLTAMGAVGDRIAGLDAGADDYLVKPFDTDELLARVRAVARRPVAWTPPASELCFGDLTLRDVDLTLSGPGAQATLSKKEAALLAELMRSDGNTITRNTLFQRVWSGAEVEDGNLDSYVHFLRKRLREVRSAVKLLTVRGVGFRLSAP